MKKIINFLILIIVNIFVSYSQININEFENILFDKVNEYRSNKNLPILIKNDDLKKMCDHHCKYLYIINKINFENYLKDTENNKYYIYLSHDEEIKIDSLNCKDFDKRGTFFNSFEENNYSFISYDYELNNYDNFSKRVINGWDKSPSHHKVLNEKEAKYLSISITYFEFETIKSDNFERKTYRIIVNMNISN